LSISSNRLVYPSLNSHTNSGKNPGKEWKASWETEQGNGGDS